MRKQKARDRRNTLIALGSLGLIIVIAVVLFLRPGLIVPMPNSAYGSSLGSTLNGGGGSCSPSRDSDWLLCDVETDPGSGAGRQMLLQKDGRGCWSAKNLRADETTLEGCAGLWDLLMPSEPGGSVFGID